MKVFRKKHRNLGEGQSSLYGGSSQGLASWAVTDASKFKSLSKQAKMASQRAPEFWVPPNSSRLIRFLDEDPVASFEAYRFKYNGKWSMFVKPPPGKPDLFASALGMRAGRMFVYRIIDIEGFTTKKGKTFKNIFRFYVIGTKNFDQVQMVKEENADSFGALTDYNVKIKRSGEGQNTTYLFIPKAPTPLTPDMKKGASQAVDWRKFYRPLTLAEQQTVVAAMGGSADGDDGDDD